MLEGATDAPEKAATLARILAPFKARRSNFYCPDDALLAADPHRLDGLGVLVWGLLDMPPALERRISQVAQRLPVDTFVPGGGPSTRTPGASKTDRHRASRPGTARSLYPLSATMTSLLGGKT